MEDKIAKRFSLNPSYMYNTLHDLYRDNYYTFVVRFRCTFHMNLHLLRDPLKINTTDLIGNNLTQYSLYSLYDLDHYMNYILFVGDHDIASMFVPRVYLVKKSSKTTLPLPYGVRVFCRFLARRVPVVDKICPK